MTKILATLTQENYKKLCEFDYGQLYSIHTGVEFVSFGNNLKIFCGVNRYGRLFINVNFYPEGHKSFDFDKLDEAVKWAKKHIEVK